MKYILVSLLFLLTFFPVKATDYEHVKISILTVEPRSNEVYTIFGHTALRVSDPDNKVDVVFNWGTFDFDAPNFIWRFIKGETDYFLSTTYYQYFVASYGQSGATVIEQVIDLPADDKEKLINALHKNLRPENVTYRYDFFFDNCTSRVRDLLEKSNDGKLIYPEQDEPVTLRKLIHECTAPYPWLGFGIDILIGSGADSLVSYRNELWLPEKLMNAIDDCVVEDVSGNHYPLLLSKKTIVQPADDGKLSQTKSKHWLAPFNVGLILFIVTLWILLMFPSRRKRFRILFSLLYLTAGLGGCIVAFTCFLSSHPCTNPNWNLVWINPFYLIGAVGFLLPKTYRLITWYHGLNFVLLLIFLSGWFFIPQSINPGAVFFVLSFALISGYQAITFKRK